MQWHIDHEHDKSSKVTSKPKQSQIHVASVSKCFPTSSGVKSVQPTIASRMVDGKISKARQEAIDDALLKLLVGKVLPLSLVDHPLFHGFVNLLDSRYLELK